MFVSCHSAWLFLTFSHVRNGVSFAAKAHCLNDKTKTHKANCSVIGRMHWTLFQTRRSAWSASKSATSLKFHAVSCSMLELFLHTLGGDHSRNQRPPGEVTYEGDYNAGIERLATLLVDHYGASQRKRERETGELGLISKEHHVLSFSTFGPLPLLWFFDIRRLESRP